MKVSAEERRSNPPFFDGWHPGDLYLYDRTSGQKTRLTDTEAAESDPRLVPDGKRFWFQSEATGWSRLYTVDPAHRRVRHLHGGR